MKRFLILLVLLLVCSVMSAKQCVEYYRYNFSLNSGNSINMLQFENICKQAEQFLKDSEV